MTLLLFLSGQLTIGPLEAPFHPLQDFHNDDHSILCTDLHDALIDERVVDIEEAKTILTWLVQTLQDSKLNVPLSYCT